MSTTLHYLINWYYEMVINNNMDNSGSQETCWLGIVTKNAFGDILRTISFFVALMSCTRKCSGLFPLPFTWIFRDLSKFLFEPVCVKVFRHYLLEKEKDKIEYLEQIMELYLSSFREIEQDFEDADQMGLGTFLMKPTETTQKQLFLENIEKLQPSFDRFKKTVSYKALYKKVQEFEQISERVYK